MKLSKIEVLKIANLSSLEIKQEKITEMQKKLENILDLFSILDTCNTKGMKPMSHPLEAVQRLRSDNIIPVENLNQLQALAPEATGNLYLVPKVIE